MVVHQLNLDKGLGLEEVKPLTHIASLKGYCSY
jgi:hypothetical protein